MSIMSLVQLSWRPEDYPLPDARELLKFEGPVGTLTVEGKARVLPKPIFWSEAQDCVHFRAKVVKNLYSPHHVLYHIIDQKVHTREYKMFEMLDRRVSYRAHLNKHVDLDTMKFTIVRDPTYGPDQIRNDLQRMKDRISLFFTDKKQKAKAYKNFKFLEEETRAELKEYEACKECVANYYSFDDPFLIPCTNLHGVAVVTLDRKQVPVKVLNIKEGNRIRVALFGDKNHKRIWIRQSSMKPIAGAKFFINDKITKEAVEELKEYFLYIAARFNKWFVRPRVGDEKMSLPSADEEFSFKIHPCLRNLALVRPVDRKFPWTTSSESPPNHIVLYKGRKRTVSTTTDDLPLQCNNCSSNPNKRFIATPPAEVTSQRSSSDSRFGFSSQSLVPSSPSVGLWNSPRIPVRHLPLAYQSRMTDSILLPSPSSQSQPLRQGGFHNRSSSQPSPFRWHTSRRDDFFRSLSQSRLRPDELSAIRSSSQGFGKSQETREANEDKENRIR